VSERERLAFHEAGHGLVAHRIGDAVVEVTLARGDHHDGATHRTSAWPRDGLTAEQREIICASGGYIAEQVVIGEHDHNRCTFDRNVIWNAAAWHVARDSQPDREALERMNREGLRVQCSQWERLREAMAVIEGMEARCRSILEEGREDLEALASHLDRHGSIKGNEIVSICEAARRARPQRL